MTKSARVLIAVLLLTTGVTAAWGIRGTAVGHPTFVDLQAAFTAASNAQIRYLAFAQKADQEGYGEVASLFRAAARSEQIQAGNYAGFLKKIGASVDPELDEPVVKSTSDNLERSIKAEAHERERLYPQFIQRAQAHGDLVAVKAFDNTVKAANEHHRLFAEAFRNLEKLSGTSRKTFYVCAECGLTSSTLDFESCPCCFDASKKFIEVN
jgi:rubrerythrin